MLPTKERTLILRNKYKFTEAHGNPLVFDDKTIDKIEERGYIPQHLYLTSDDKIKEGDYAWDKQTNSIYKVGKFTSKAGHEAHSIKLLKSDVKEGETYTFIGTRYSQYSKKIIATTDKSLKRAENDPHNKHSRTLPQPSKTFIKDYCKAGGIDEVMVEYEALVKAYIPFTNAKDYIPKVNSHNEITIHPIKNSYTIKELQELCKQHPNDTVLGAKLRMICK